ncbi:MAG: L-2-amino-thiazoline-4-carboxylic acid hydrolase, partial [Desulfatiglandales bacterium]
PPLGANQGHVFWAWMVYSLQHPVNGHEGRYGYMGEDLSKVGILVRREIEARIAAPLIKAFIDEIGREKTLKIVERVIESLAVESGQQFAKLVGGNSIEDFSNSLKYFTKDNALELEVIESSPKKLLMDVKRCRYAEMYRELGIEEFGFLLSCGRDFAMVRGFNPKIRFKRTKTLMKGDDCCDFRYEMVEED